MSLTPSQNAINRYKLQYVQTFKNHVFSYNQMNTWNTLPDNLNYSRIKNLARHTRLNTLAVFLVGLTSFSVRLQLIFFRICSKH